DLIMAKSSKENTYEKIILASIELFNEQGERYVTTNHIVAHLGISPGNLYYYFQNKEEIIEEIFKRYEKELLEFIQGEAPEVEGYAALRYVFKIFDIMWRYRFIFTDLSVLLEKNESLSQMQRDYTNNKITPLINNYLDALIENGVIHMTPIDLKVFKNNFWLLVRYWFDYDKMARGELKQDSKVRGSIQVLGLLKPYLNEEDKLIFDEVYLRLAQGIDL
ncbi:MAG: TetR/AcrR family transcriptional regulator, partial [Neisseriaceae bacterium]|nr:TetR/AcrR family transcriptional regulator [Neisseriaceae bacterium]